MSKMMNTHATELADFGEGSRDWNCQGKMCPRQDFSQGFIDLFDDWTDFNEWSRDQPSKHDIERDFDFEQSWATMTREQQREMTAAAYRGIQEEEEKASIRAEVSTCEDWDKIRPLKHFWKKSGSFGLARKFKFLEIIDQLIVAVELEIRQSKGKTL